MDSDELYFKTHLIIQINELVKSGIPAEELRVVNRKAIKHNYISKLEIQDKIDELNKEKEKYDNEFRLYTLRDTFDFQITILNELLKASEENA